jgi:hypothetical protein
MKVCDFDGCHKPHHAKGLCGTHYHRTKTGNEAYVRRLKKVQAERSQANREMAANKRAAGMATTVSGEPLERDARRLMAMIPPDTRDLTARFFGDPLPGRRALDRRQA